MWILGFKLSPCSEFWVIPRGLNSDTGELPRRKHTTNIWMFAAMLIKCWYYLGRKEDVSYSFRSWRETFKNHSLTWSAYIHVRVQVKYMFIYWVRVYVHKLSLWVYVCVFR